MNKKKRKKFYRKLAKEFGKRVIKYGLIAAEIWLTKELEKLERK